MKMKCLKLQSINVIKSKTSLNKQLVKLLLQHKLTILTYMYMYCNRIKQIISYLFNSSPSEIITDLHFHDSIKLQKLILYISMFLNSVFTDGKNIHHVDNK